MPEEIKPMSYQEAWQKCQEDYLVAIGCLYKYILEKYGEEALIRYLEEVEVERFRKYFEKTVSRMARMLAGLAPGKAFKEKMRAIAYEFQFFLGVNNIKAEDLDEEKAVAHLLECPYQRALRSAPKGLGLTRDLYCKYQCRHYIKKICKDVLGFSIEFDPQEKGCIYRVSRQ